MSLALVQKAQLDGLSGAGVGVTLGSAPTSGNLLVCLGWTWWGSITLASGWTLISQDTATAVGYAWVLAYKVAGVGESATQSPWTQGGNTWNLTVYEISGQATGAAAINGHSGNQVAGTPVTCIAVTPSIAGCMGLTSGIALGGTSDAAAPAGWTLDFQLTTNISGDQARVTSAHLAALTSGTPYTPAFSWAAVSADTAAVLVIVAPPGAVVPVVTSISPTSGSTLGGTPVTITGTGFTGATSASVGALLTSFVVVNDTTITGVTAVHTAGIVDVVVTAPGGVGTGVGLYTFVVPAVAPIDFLAPWNITGAVRSIVYQTAASGVYTLVLLFPETCTRVTIATDSTPYATQAFQYGIPLFTNYGYQLRSDDGVAPYKLFLWQYALDETPFSATSGVFPTWTLAAGAGTALAPQVYYYTFTVTITFPDGSTQETSPTDTAFVPFALNFTLSAAGAIVITYGAVAWSGTNADGSTWTTNIYRMSTAQPTFFFVQNVSGTGTYNDDQADATIASNAQLDLYRDQPPVCLTLTGGVTTYNPGVVFSHKDRAWCFVVAQNTNTDNQPQCQLWYSDYGTPWSFNGTYQVLLVGNGDTALNPVYGGRGEYPTAAIVLASTVLLLKNGTLHTLWGDDQTTFITRLIGSYACVAPQSAADCDEMGCWLGSTAEYGVGVYACDGFSKPQYISEDIRSALDAIASDWPNAVGFYANASYYLSFPNSSITYVYHFQSKKWRSLPYATNFAYAIPGDQPPLPATQIYNEIIAVRPSTAFIDIWDGAETDLGYPITTTWTTDIRDGGKPQIQKNYFYIGLSNPLQAAGVTAYMQLTVWDYNNAVSTTRYPATGTIDLSATTWTPFRIPEASNKGFQAQVTVVLANAPLATTPAEIFNVVIGGTNEREWAIPV